MELQITIKNNSVHRLYMIEHYAITIIYKYVLSEMIHFTISWD